MTARHHIAKTGIILFALPAIFLPAACLAYIVWRGLPAMSWEFILSSGEGDHFGSSTGIQAQLIGSLLLAIGASLIATPIALGAALYYRLLATPRQRKSMDSLLNMLQGIPPIVFGLSGLIIFVHLLQWGVSLAAGAVILAIVILPMLVLNTIAALTRVGHEYTEAAQCLGLNDNALVGRVWLPMAWRGIMTGLLLGIARALSETAPIIFTATVFSGVVWPDSIFSPVTTLQTHIFYLAQEGGTSQAVSVAWGSALVLVMVVAGFGLLARWLKQLGDIR